MKKATSLKNINKSLIIKGSDSGDVTGDKSEVVGYLSGVVYHYLSLIMILKTFFNN